MNELDTFIVSDLHLSDSQIEDKKNPLWKKFKQKQFFFDNDFSNFINKILQTNSNKKELILNGDIFDFDSVVNIPEDLSKYSIKKYELKSGLNTMEDKSLFKIKYILKEHEVWVQSIKKFIEHGHKVVFILGNHDVELCWPKVQKAIIKSLDLDKKYIENIVFCEWYYISNKDTLIEHGHQYDPYCMTIDPINPIINKNGKYKVRLPFGNLATRFMINLMGLRNPYNESVYVGNFLDFLKFYIKYELKYQPLIFITWFSGALKTLIYSIGEGFFPALKDPQTLSYKLEDISEKSNSTVSKTIQLKENHAHSAVRRPYKILKELWLDRAFFLFIILFICWHIFITSALFAGLSLKWFLIPFLTSLGFFTYYAHGVSSDIQSNQELGKRKGIISCKICHVNRIVLGHTHKAEKSILKDNIEYFNSGTWSYYFKDIECSQKVSKQTFIWLKSEHNKREGFLCQWIPKDNNIKIIK